MHRSGDSIRGDAPAFDPELAEILAANPRLSSTVLPEHVSRFREAQAAPPFRIGDEQLRRGGRIDFEERRIAAADGDGEIDLLILRPAGAAAARPGLCYFHGGGMFSGDNRTGIDPVLDWVEALGLVVLSAGYRLAPEHGHPAPVEDCFAALAWMDAQRETLGLDGQPLIVAGASAGGGLAAGVSLLVRERGGPALSDQVLMCPMLDDCARFPSSTALNGEGVWDSRSNRTGWEALLGAAGGGPDVPSCAAPSREQDLHGLPAAFVDVGSAETYRDEAIDYASRLAQSGVLVELHVWAGAFHGFDVIAPHTAVAKAARAARIDHLRRRLGARARS